MPSRFAFALVLALAAVASRPRTASAVAACTANDVINQDKSTCPNSLAPCSIRSDFEVGDGCTLDFGDRVVTISGSSDIFIGQGALTLKARSLIIAASGLIDGRGDVRGVRERGGLVVIRTTGAVDVQRRGAAGRIDVSGNLSAGQIQIVAGGNVTLTGDVFADSLTSSGSGGSIIVDAGGDLIVSSATGVIGAGDVSAMAGAGVSGVVDFAARGRVDLGAEIDLTGSDGGSLNVSAETEAVIRRVLASANGDLGSGGEISIAAGGRVQLLDRIFANGSSASDGTGGGCGGAIDIDAQFGDLTVAADVLAEGATPDGVGGTITFNAGGSMTLQGAVAPIISARSGGAFSCGGEICISTQRTLTSMATLDVSAGAGAGVIDIVAHGNTMLAGPLRGTASSNDSPGGDIRVDTFSGTLQLTSVIDVTGGLCDVFGSCGTGGFVSLASCNLSVAPTGSILARGGTGGTINLNAREQLTVSGTLNATHGIGPGENGRNQIIHPTRLPPTLGGSITPAPLLGPRPTCVAENTPPNCLVPCPTCGNGVVEFPETCDTPGTPQACDGCSLFCTIENCDDSNFCTIDTCDPAFGCHNTPKPPGISCADNLACNGVEQCVGGSCAAAPLDCNDNNACTVDSCDEVHLCQHLQLPEGTTCSDANACTVGDACHDGACRPGAPRVCVDGRECTNDGCNAASGCVFTNRTGTCTDDGNPCTSDTCSAGTCLHPTLANGMPCTDAAFCTVGETCQAGFCVSGGARDCSDATTCTVDACNEATDTCTHTPEPSGTTCTDNSVCTINDSCDAGVCHPGVARNCDDGDPCTEDTCDPVDGCQHRTLDPCVTTTSTSTTTSSTGASTSTSTSSTSSTAPPTSTSTSTTTSSSTAPSSSSTSTTTSSSTAPSSSSTSTTTSSSTALSSSSTSTTTSSSTAPSSSSTSTSTTSTTTTTSPLCGNTQLDDGEECDPPGSITCPPGSPAGAFVACGSDCQCPTISTSTSTSTSSSTSTSIRTTSSSTSTSTTSSTSSSTSTSTTTSSTTTSSSSSTSTSTTVPTTSTTMPCTTESCQDGDPCTVDTCAAGGCRHDAATGLASVTCAFENAPLQPPLCVGERVPRTITKPLDQARKRAGKAADIGDPRLARPLVKKAVRALKEARGVIVRVRGRRLSAECADGLTGAVDNAITRARRWLDGA